MMIPLPLSTDNLSACPECDLLIELNPMREAGFISQCPQCLHVLEHPTNFSIRKDMLCLLTGLLMYFPAMLLPIMRFTMIGHTEAMSMLSCLETLFITGNIGIGIVVLISIFCIPLFKMTLLLFVMSRVYYQIPSQYLAFSFKSYNRINAWGMLDILLLSFIVAAIKLRDDAELLAGVGLYAFLVLLLASALQTQLLNKNLIWRLIECHQ
jgi:paraquat-inducible protein A